MKSFLKRIRTSSNPSGEMPFFDHLEELRWRIVWSLLALIGGTALGFYLSVRFDILAMLKRPLDPYIDGQPLLNLALTGPFFLTFKIALTLGIIFAAPVIAYQAWSFFAPALTKREKRAILPALYLGIVLFFAGVSMAYVYVVPMTVRFFEGFQTSSMTLALTADLYFGFIMKLLIAFGVIFELPVVVMILATLGLVTSKFLASKRRFALAGMAVTSALLTPGDAITATVFMMGPLILLYELSILLTKVIERSKLRAAAADALAEAP